MSIMEYKRKSKIWGIHTVCCFLFVLLLFAGAYRCIMGSEESDINPEGIPAFTTNFWNDTRIDLGNDSEGYAYILIKSQWYRDIPDPGEEDVKYPEYVVIKRRGSVPITEDFAGIEGTAPNEYVVKKELKSENIAKFVTEEIEEQYPALFDGSEEYVFRVIDYDEDILWTPDDELKSFGYGIMGLLGGLILGFLGCVNAILAIIFAIIYIVNLLKYKSLKNNV